MECPMSNKVQKARTDAAKKLGILEDNLEENLLYEAWMQDTLQNSFFDNPTLKTGISSGASTVQALSVASQESFTLREFLIW